VFATFTSSSKSVFHHSFVWRMAFVAEHTSRPPSPSAALDGSATNENLWDSILNSVSTRTRRPIPSGSVLILGEPSTGKSTIANSLLQRSGSAAPGQRHSGAAGIENGGLGLGGEWAGKSDFALGYHWTNVKEEGEEGGHLSPYPLKKRVQCWELLWCSTD
jgi:dynein light intermediate chain 1